MYFIIINNQACGECLPCCIIIFFFGIILNVILGIMRAIQTPFTDWGIKTDE